MLKESCWQYNWKNLKSKTSRVKADKQVPWNGKYLKYRSEIYAPWKFFLDFTHATSADSYMAIKCALTKKMVMGANPTWMH